jgi:hypothetical protein
MLDDGQYHDIVSWGIDGTSFVVKVRSSFFPYFSLTYLPFSLIPQPLTFRSPAGHEPIHD